MHKKKLSEIASAITEDTLFNVLHKITFKIQSGLVYGSLIIIFNIYPVLIYILVQYHHLLNGYIPDQVLKILNFMFLRYIIGEPNTISGLFVFFTNILFILLVFGSHFLILLKLMNRTLIRNVYYALHFAGIFILIPLTSYLFYYLVNGNIGSIGVNILMKILTVVILLFNVTYCGFITVLLKEYRFHTYCSLARPCHDLLIVDKLPILALIIIDSLLSTNNIASISIHIVFVLSILMLIVNIWLPYYDKRMNTISLIASFILFWTSFILVIQINIQSEIITNNIIIAFCIGYVFSIVIFIRYRNWYIDYLLDKPNALIKDTISYHLKIRFLYDLIRNSKYDKVDDMRINSLLQIHKNDCLDAKCTCRKKIVEEINRGINLDNDKRNLKHLKFVNTILLNYIEEGIARFENSILLIIDKIIIYNELLGNVFVANSLISNLKENHKNALNTFQKFILYNEDIMIKNSVEIFNQKNAQHFVDISLIKNYDYYFDKIKYVKKELYS